MLKLAGIRPEVAPGGRGWVEYLEGLKARVRERLWAEIARESQRLAVVKGQIHALEGLQREALQTAPDDPLMRMIFGPEPIAGNR